MNQPTVLIVDDGAVNRRLLHAHLAALGCQPLAADHGPAALEMVVERTVDLVLLDVQMPGMDGFEVCRRIKSDPATRLLPVVMITALSETQDRVKALEAGADDFMSKPIDRAELAARVRSALSLKGAYDQLESTEQVLYSLAAAVEAKDRHTQAHTKRVAGLARRLAERLGLGEADLDLAYRGGRMHDIGKIGIPDAVLLKPGPLDAGEWTLMRQHPAIGESILRPLGSASGLLPIVRHHHEKWDGSGYPDGLEGHEIPLLARIVAACDGYDSLVSDRPYRAGRSHDAALSVLNQGKGRHWDPELVELLAADLPAPVVSGV